MEEVFNMSKVSNNEKVERQTTIEKPNRIDIPLVNGCFVPIAVCALMVLCINECKRSGIRWEEEKIKLEQMKKGALVDTTPVVTPDTLRVFNYQKVYIPMSKMYGKQK